LKHEGKGIKPSLTTHKGASIMTLTLTASTVELDQDQADNLVSDLSDLSIEIDEMLTSDDRAAKLAALLNKLNLLADIYS
jgi:hypothetical protein